MITMSLTMLTGCGNKENGTANKEDTNVVNIAIQPSAAFIPLFVAREKGWIEEALEAQGVMVVWNDFESGPPMNESLAAGTSDIGVMGDVPCVSAIAAGQKNEIVAMGAIGPASYALLAGADSDINSPADLAGKIVGTTVGSTGHNLTDKLLAQNGLDINKDIQLANISTGDAATVLSTGEVDAVALWEPNITRLVEDGTAKIIGEGTQCGLRGVNPIIARADYAQEHPEVIKVIIEQYARAVAELSDLDESTTQAVARQLSIEPQQLSRIIGKYEYTVTITQEDIASFQDTIDFLVKIGNLEEAYDISEYVKTSYLE